MWKTHGLRRVSCPAHAFFWHTPQEQLPLSLPQEAHFIGDLIRHVRTYLGTPGISMSPWSPMGVINLFSLRVTSSLS